MGARRSSDGCHGCDVCSRAEREPSNARLQTARPWHPDLCDRRVCPFLPALLAAAALLLATAGASAAGDADLIVTGNEQALWIIRPSGLKTFDIAVRPVGKTWKRIARDLPGVVQAAAAVDRHVHLILSDPFAHLIIHVGDTGPVQAQSPQDPRWPKDAPVLAAFEMADPNGGNSSSMVVVVADPAGRAATGTASAPSPRSRPALERRPAPRAATESATSTPTDRGALQVFRYAEGRWEHVAEFTDLLRKDARPLPLGPPVLHAEDSIAGHPGAPLLLPTRVFGSAADAKIYLYIDEPGRVPRVVQWNAQAWQTLPAWPPTGPAEVAAFAASEPVEAQTAPAPTTARRGLSDAAAVFAMVSVGRQILVLRALPEEASAEPGTRPATAPARWRVQLAALRPDGGPVLHDVRPIGETAPWTAPGLPDSPLHAARLGSQIALLWRQDDRLQMGTTDLTGNFVPLESVDVFKPEPPVGQGEDIRNYVILGALILSSLLALQMRGRVPLRPLALPPGVAVADPFRRMLAGIIDLVPLCMLAGAFAPVPAASFQELLQRAKENRLPNSAYLAAMAAICLYAAYCVFMEHRFGTTLGKAVLKLRVTNDQGQTATLEQIALRNVLKIVELLWPSVPVLLLMPLLNRNRQRLGDLFARTVVVTGTPLPAPPPPRDGAEDNPPRE